MATHDYNLANQDGASFRSDLNNALAAIVSNNSSSTAPATTFAHQIWVDTTANVIKQRNAANDAWIELWRIDGGFNAKTFSSNVTLNAQSDLRFADSDSSNWVAFQAPATVASNVTWTLPSADGTADQALTTNGSGVLSWADAGGTTDNITEGNTSAEVVDTGSDGHFKVITEGTEALRVTAAQRVGINTISPDDALHVLSSDGNLRIDTSTNGGSASLLFDVPASNGLRASGHRAEIACEHTGAGWDSSLVFYAGNTSTTPSEAFRVDTSRRLLVNTTSTINTGTGDKVQIAETVGANILLGRNDTAVTDGNNLGQIAAYSFHGSSWNESARIQFAADGAHAGSGDVPGKISFQVCKDGVAGVGEQMQLDNAGNLKFNSGYGSVATAYGVRAWARFEQIGTQSVVGSGGISTISDLGTGMTQLNFSFTMPDTNYAVVSIGSPTWAAHTLIADDLASYQTTTSCRIECRNVSFTLVDSGNPQIAIFR